MSYKPQKTISKGAEAPAWILGGSYLLVQAAQAIGWDVDQAQALTYITAAYGLYKAIRNYLKNR